MSISKKTSENPGFYYDEKRTALEVPEIEERVIRGAASIREAHEVLIGYLDYIFGTLRAVDHAYMNRDKTFDAELRLGVINEGISKCLSAISFAKSTLKHYPELINIVDGVYSSIRFQDVFTINAIDSELHSGSLFDASNTGIH